MITSFEVFVPVLMGSGSSFRTGLKVRELGCSRMLAVYDKGLEKAGIAGTVVDNIRNAGIEVVPFDGVVPDPPDSIIEEAAEIARSEEVDGIVAVGGGSVIDTAKAVNVLMNNPSPITNYFGLQKNLQPGVPSVFIPTTSGTGSEVTNISVISCPSLGKKDTIISPACTGTLAIIDPDLTLGLPPDVTAATGADALAHAVESMTGGQQNPFSDALAKEAIRTIAKWLPAACRDGFNLEAREQMILASMYAGMAFTNALVHLGHSIAHTIGAQFHIPHGVACAMTLPEVAEYAAVTEYNKVRMICECLGEEVPEGAAPEETGAAARKALRSLIKSVGIPNIKEHGISLEEAVQLAPKVMEDTGFAMAPYRISSEKIAEMIKSAYDA